MSEKIFERIESYFEGENLRLALSYKLSNDTKYVVDIYDRDAKLLQDSVDALDSCHDKQTLYNRHYFIDTKSATLRYREGGKEETIAKVEAVDLCVGQYGDGCGGGRIFLVDKVNKKIKVYEQETHAIMTLVECHEVPYSIVKSGCDLYILSKKSVTKFNISTMTSEKFIQI